MKISVTKRVAIIAIILTIALAMPLLAANIRPTGVTAGTGGLQTKGGEIRVQTVAGADLFRVVRQTGALTAKVLATTTITAAAGTTQLTDAHYGQTIFVTGEAAETINLPANGAPAGAWMRIIVVGSNSTIPTVAAKTADTLITQNDAQADSVTFGTGHRIGACLFVISTGTYWVAINEGSTTMTVNT